MSKITITTCLLKKKNNMSKIIRNNVYDNIAAGSDWGKYTKFAIYMTISLTWWSIPTILQCIQWTQGLLTWKIMGRSESFFFLSGRWYQSLPRCQIHFVLKSFTFKTFSLCNKTKERTNNIRMKILNNSIVCFVNNIESASFPSL